MPVVDASSLRGLCDGAVHLPGDQSYEAARVPWNEAVDQHPAAIAYPANAGEVADVVRVAAKAGLRVAPQGPGHNPGGLGPLDDVVLLRTAGMLGLRVDPDLGRLRASAGTLWVDALAAATPHGLTARHPTGPDVGVVGYSLGGGVGWFARNHGLQSAAVTAVELVTADGSLVRADAQHESDLFWALRGGGGNFGVVVALEFGLLPIRSAYAGTLAWPWSRTEDVLTRWLDWASTAPESVTTTLRILQIPEDEHSAPEPLRGRQVVAIDGVVLGDDIAGARALGPLRDLKPELDTFAVMAAADLIYLHADPIGPHPSVSASAVLANLPPAGVDAMLAVAGPDSDSTVPWVELRHLGGTLARTTPADGSATVDGQFLLFVATAPSDPAAVEAARVQVRSVVAAMAAYDSGRLLLNFASSTVDRSRGYRPDDWQRLRSIRAAVDPSRLWVANHPI